MATSTDRPARIEPDYPKDRTTLGGPRLGPLGWARWAWRQLTSMRTALALLLLLAVAAIPGSIWPQRSVDPVRVRTYFEENPELAPWLDRLQLFDVYSSPWFAAIYLLLMVSLVGCILPRSRQHLQALRAAPPRAPRRFTRLPVQREAMVAAAPADVAAAARTALARRRFRLRDEEPAADGGVLTVSAEKGYLKETGNLVFHLALLGVIVSVAAGSLYGWRGEIIIKEGESWTSGAGTYDTLNLGPLVDEQDVPTFTIQLETLDVSFEADAEGAQFGQPRQFEGSAVLEVPGEEPERQEFAVNDPLSVDGDSVFLLGNGYAPVVTYRDTEGQILYSDAVTFLPQDNNYSSEGAIKVVGSDPELGFVGGFLPTLDFAPGPTSAFPGLVDPALVLAAYEGELFPDGRPQSVFSIPTQEMDQVMADEDTPVSVLLRPGERYELPGDRGTLEFEDVIRWGGLLVRHDPGRMPALAFSGLALAAMALMLGVRRRRVFVRVSPAGAGEEGHTVVDVAGLPKGTDPGLEGLVDDVLRAITDASGGPVAWHPDRDEKDEV